MPRYQHSLSPLLSHRRYNVSNAQAIHRVSPARMTPSLPLLKLLGAAPIAIILGGALSPADGGDPASQTAQAGSAVLPIVSIEATDPRAQEDAGVARVTIARTGPTTDALGVDFALSGTATRNVDYTLSGPGISSTDPNDTRLTIRAGATSSEMTVRGIRDNLVEGNETVIITLVNRTVYTLGSPASATITVIDQRDLTPPTVAITAPADGAKVGGSVVITADASDPSTGGGQASGADFL